MEMLAYFSFFLNHESDGLEEAFLKINTNFLETNVINILLLVGLLIYGYITSFGPSLERRQKEIIATIESAQNDVLNATNYYFLAEKGLTQSLFWLQSWKTLYEQEKLDIVNTKYIQVKNGFKETFLTNESIIANFEKKSFLSLQRYILFLTASRILRKFFLLSEAEKSKIIERIILNLEDAKK